MSGRLTIYSTTWCGVCVRLKRGLEREGIEFDEINIEADPEAEAVRPRGEQGHRDRADPGASQRRGHDQPAAPGRTRRPKSRVILTKKAL